MKKRILTIMIAVAIAAVSAVAGHVWTMTHLTIETDGDGDSAIIEVAGHYWFTGINGYEPDAEFMEGYNGL